MVSLTTSASINLLRAETQKLALASAPKQVHVRLDAEYPIVRICHRDSVPYDYEACSAVNTILHAVSPAVKIVIGSVGSGKTSANLQRLLYRAVTMPKCDDGVRRYRALLIRTSTASLERTTLKTWLAWTRGLPPPINRESDRLQGNKEFVYEFWDDYGLIHLELFFLPLDRPQSARDLGSLEPTDIFVNEVRDIPLCIFERITERMGRYPQKILFNNIWEKFHEEHSNIDYKDWFPFKFYCTADTNAPDERHWIKDLEDQELETMRVYHQPPSLIKDKENKYVINSDCDNAKYLDPTYYLRMIDKGDSYVRVYGRGEYGLVKEGEVVFPQYNDDIHSINNLEPTKTDMIILGWDFGLTPACLICQRKKNGQLLALKEFVSDRAEIKSFAEHVVYPYLLRNFPNAQVSEFGDLPATELFSVADPSGSAGQDMGISSIQALTNIGIKTIAAKTNQLLPRLEAVKLFLTKLIDGQPAFLMDKKQCETLRKSFLVKYCYKAIHIVGTEALKDTPDKSHPYSDIMDCLQYICCEFSGTGIRLIQKKVEFHGNIYRDTSTVF